MWSAKEPGLHVPSAACSSLPSVLVVLFAELGITLQRVSPQFLAKVTVTVSLAGGAGTLMACVWRKPSHACHSDTACLIFFLMAAKLHIKNDIHMTFLENFS